MTSWWEFAVNKIVIFVSCIGSWEGSQQGSSHQGWQAQKSGYIPEEVATYALALFTKYQNRTDISWTKYLNPSPKKMFEKNIKYLTTTADEIRFK